MKIGLNYAFGANAHHDIGFITGFAQAVEAQGFSSLWMPEHVVSFPASSYRSPYPYSSDGSVPWRGDLSLLDPLFVCAAAAQVTTRLTFGSGVLILPQRPALLTAKELMTLDHLTGGRFELGAGAGWSAEEYEVLGVPFERRGRRFDETIEAMRAVWQASPASYQGEFVAFEDVVLLPAPLTPGGPPILIGGSSPPALRRAARLGDGWFGHWSDTAQPEEEIERLRAALEAESREGPFPVKVSLPHYDAPEELSDRLERASNLGVDELVLIVPVRTRTFEADLQLWAAAAGLDSSAARATS